MTSPSKEILILGAHPVHPRQALGAPRDPSYIEFSVILSYLKGEPVATVRMDREEAIYQIEKLVTAVRNTRPQP